MCGLFFEGVGDWVAGKRGERDLVVSLVGTVTYIIMYPIPNTLKKHPTHLV